MIYLSQVAGAAAKRPFILPLQTQKGRKILIWIDFSSRDTFAYEL